MPSFPATTTIQPSEQAERAGARLAQARRRCGGGLTPVRSNSAAASSGALAMTAWVGHVECRRRLLAGVGREHAQQGG